MKIKSPHIPLRFICETSPQLGGARRTKEVPGDFRTASFLGRRLEIFDRPLFTVKANAALGAHPLELMIRIHFLQLVYNLSDPMCEETLRDSFACRRFSSV
ncbi:MAG: transposase [Parasutterella sp.]